jgi:hypothetical protein
LRECKIDSDFPGVARVSEGNLGGYILIDTRRNHNMEVLRESEYQWRRKEF